MAIRFPRWSLIFALVAAMLTGRAGATSAEPVGRIDKVIGTAHVVRAGQELAIDGDQAIMVHDRMKTGPSGRLRLVMEDGSRITLGERTIVAIDAWLYRPDDNQGHLGLRLVSGSVLAASGGLTGIPGASFLVRTPSATIAVRGTEFWAGPIDGQFGILLLDGRIALENTAGKVDLSEPGTGLFLPLAVGPDVESVTEPAGAWTLPGAAPVAGGAPSPTMAWDEELISRALRAVSLD